MLLIGLSGKARHGKDTCGSYLVERYGFRGYSFAAALKDECAQLGWTPENKNEPARNAIARVFNKIPLNGDCSGLTPLEHELVVFVNNHKQYHWENISPDTSFLQWYGTNFRRAKNPNYWVNVTFGKIYKDYLECLAQRSNPECIELLNQLCVDIHNGTSCRKLMLDDPSWKICITDCRFINEFKSIKDNGGQVWRLQRMDHNDIKVMCSLPMGGSTIGTITEYYPYIDPERDPNHPSEIELDGIPHDFTITHHTVEQIYQQTDNIMKYLGVV